MLTGEQLRRHLETIGAMVDGATTNARARRCPKCRAWTVRGLTQPPMQQLIVVDPAPLSCLGELQAVQAGLVTFDLARRAGRLDLEEREASHISGSPADRPDMWRRRADVVAEHRCGAYNPFDMLPTSRIVR